MSQPPEDARHALRELMSELSKDAYCAAWHYDTEYRLWEILKHGRRGWMALSADDPRISELRRRHEVIGGWWWLNPVLGDGDDLGEKEFVTAAAWEAIYARMVDGKDGAIFAEIGGKPLRGEAALKATRRRLLKRERERKS